MEDLTLVHMMTGYFLQVASLLGAIFGGTAFVGGLLSLLIVRM